MKRILFIFIFLLTACAEPPLVALQSNVRMDALRPDDIDGISLFLYEGMRKDHIVLTCGTLLFRDLTPTDSKLDVLATKNAGSAELSSDPLTIQGITVGTGRVLYIEAYKAGDVKGNGCTADIAIDAGKTTAVDITVYPL